MVTNQPEIRIADDLSALARAAAAEFVELAREAVGRNGVFTVALSGGSTPRELYATLADPKRPYREQTDWGRIQFYWGDERHVPPGHADSNFRMAYEAMLSKLRIPADHVHRMLTENPNADAAARAYEQELQTQFALENGRRPRFDLVLLGLGPEGHTASLFPGSDALCETKRLVAAPWVEKHHTFRVTLTPSVINNASHVMFLVSGEQKADIVRQVLLGPQQPNHLPAQLIRPESGPAMWFLDRAASQLLSNQ